MRAWLTRFWKKYNPFDIHTVIRDMADSIHEVRTALQDIRYNNTLTIALLENQLAEKELVLQQFVDVMPDMVWFKEYDEHGVGGKYVYANAAIREQLLLCPNPVGSNDTQLAMAAKAFYGDENHTFGEKCGNSDLVTLENWKIGKKASRFLESGMVKGKMMYLEVNKSVVLSADGSVLGVCGSGRLLTDYIEAVRYLENNCTIIDDLACNLAIGKLLATFRQFEYGEE